MTTYDSDQSEPGGGGPTNPADDRAAGGASAGEEGAPIGFGAVVGGAPGTTDDPDEAKALANGPDDGPSIP